MASTYDDISIREFLTQAFDNETIEQYAQRIKGQGE